MNLPKLNKLSGAGLTVGLIIGGAITASAVTGNVPFDLHPNSETVGNSSQSASTGSTPGQTVTTQSDGSSVPAAGTSTPTTTPGLPNLAPGGVSPSSTPTTPAPDTPASPIVPPPSIVGVQIDYVPSATAGLQDGICTFTYSDGSTVDKFVGRRPIPDIHLKVDLECPDQP